MSGQMMLPGSNWPPRTAPPPASSLPPAGHLGGVGRPAVANACRVLPGLAEPSGSGAGTWPQRRQAGRGGGRRGPRVSRRDASARPSLTADPGQARALIAPGPAAYLAASCPSRHTARSADRPVRCLAVRARSCGDRGLVGVGRGHPAAHSRLVLGPGPLVLGPGHQGQHWPAAIPSFKVRAIDDLGQEHAGRPGNWRSYGAGEGHGEFTLWPAVPRRTGRLRVVISTLWEARWADIELPSR